MSKVEGVILDWAGTMIDYGCFAPLDVFLKSFKKHGIEVTIDEVREPMGLLKMDHIKRICEMERVMDQWQIVFGRHPNDADIQTIYQNFEAELLKSVAEYTELIPGALTLVAYLKKRQIKIGSTTGYTSKMMEIVSLKAQEQGYQPDCYFTADEAGKGRPYPNMIYKNADYLDIYPLTHFVKIGDTVVDMQEGKNAGTWTIGVVLGSSILGLTSKEVAELSEIELEHKVNRAKVALYEAGADYVVLSIGDVPAIIEKIEQR
ncbi:phosphonoacetaldehyde hydrolase [Carnobacterium gallinarum]|uniref:phosphonoacetaldehyde hydrolase n=1 Tax=Carnobacterium gallinarum TaxID=2749 RepID=UPI00054E5E6A|nr:phosphonoacetaldehyde hydrolase [Carnobacterium gallinarum]